MLNKQTELFELKGRNLMLVIYSLKKEKKVLPSKKGNDYYKQVEVEFEVEEPSGQSRTSVFQLSLFEDLSEINRESLFDVIYAC